MPSADALLPAMPLSLNFKEMIKLAIVDDQRLMRIGISDKLKQAGDMSILFMAENGAVFLEEMRVRKPEEYPDIVLMDIDMPELNGIETVSRARPLYPSLEFIMLTVFDDDDKIFEAIRAGATGYLLKDESAVQLLHAIREVQEHRAVPFSPVIARKALQLFARLQPREKEGNGENPLSDREKEVLNGLVNGQDYKMIANAMYVSPNTVRNHISSIYRKLHVTNKVEAVKIAIRNKWF